MQQRNRNHKWQKIIGVVFLTLALTMSAVSPAGAATWREKAWKDIQVLAKDGAQAIGKIQTLTQIQSTCRYLDNGYSATTILSEYTRVANKSATSRRQLQQMYRLNLAIMAIAYAPTRRNT